MLFAVLIRPPTAAILRLKAKGDPAILMEDVIGGFYLVILLSRGATVERMKTVYVAEAFSLYLRREYQ